MVQTYIKNMIFTVAKQKINVPNQQTTMWLKSFATSKLMSDLHTTPNQFQKNAA